MKRKAILIESSNVAGQTELPGARVDVENWKNFLRSDLGGAWNDSEIITLHKPVSLELAQYLKTDADCYCFVAFSGHGCDGHVVLNESWVNEGFPIISLRPKGNKGTLIVDSCRGLSEAINFSFDAKMAFSNSSGHAVALNARRGQPTIFASSQELNERVLLNRAGAVIKPRQKWEEALNTSSNGIVEMLACSKGEGAGEDPSAGGYYTSLLLQSADIWQESGTTTTIHSTKDAHDYAANKLAVQQKPEYNPPWLKYPFAVKV